MDSFKYIQAKWVYGYHRPVDAIAKLGIKDGDSLLIVGSGFGKTAMMAAKRFKCNVIGAEIVPFFVEKANKRTHEEGLNERVNFIQLDPVSPYLDVGADRVFFESFLSFLENPSDVLSYYSKKIGDEGRIGVMEITYLPNVESEGLTARLKEFFGEDAHFRDRGSWLNIFLESKLNRVAEDEAQLSLIRKFWEDFREEPWGIIRDLSRTLYLSYTEEKAGKAMRLFRRFFREYSDKMASSYYLLEASR
ncbi:MAG: class I SAM-dependent methyltransferase [Thaumarchaeota archaeon]|nr:class I SAM-dependent methyltransferase [Nitrososphaerota archaeon]